MMPRGPWYRRAEKSCPGSWSSPGQRMPKPFECVKAAAARMHNKLCHTPFARAQTLRIVGGQHLLPEWRKGQLRIVAVVAQTLQHAVAHFYRSSEGSLLAAILLVGEVAGEMHLVAAQGDSPPLKRGELVRETGDVAYGFHNCRHSSDKNSAAPQKIGE